jgi:pimeloyl-ACP methyl ester carboxylesterase
VSLLEANHLTRRSFLTGMAASALAAGSFLGLARIASAASPRQLATTRQGELDMSRETNHSDPNSMPTVVLVHGGFADSSGWNGVITQLLAAGITVTAASNPLRGLAYDSAYVASVAQQIEGPVLLVGHSYGGAVITNAATQTPNAAGLVYIAAFALDEGESALGLLQGFPQTPIVSALRPSKYPNGAEDGLEFSLDLGLFSEAFCADVPADLATLMAATQRPFSNAGFAEVSGPPAWKTLPSWYLVASSDNAIHPDAERFMAQRAGSQTSEIEASHVPMVSQPTAVADIIRTAVASLTPVAVG